MKRPMNDDSPRVSGDMHGFPSLEVLRQNKTIKTIEKKSYIMAKRRKKSPDQTEKKLNCGHRIATDAGGAPDNICMYTSRVLFS